MGKKCASCQRGYFGLSQLNSEGCTKCFCFGRSGDCEQAPYSWTQVTTGSLRVPTYLLLPFKLVMSRRRQLTISRGNSQLATESSFIIIPGDSLDAVIGVSNLFDVPIYW